jgi:hypothetical protein
MRPSIRRYPCIRNIEHLLKLLFIRSGKVTPISNLPLIIGRDPKFFFGESVGENGVNAEGTTYIPEPDVPTPSTDPTTDQSEYPFSRGYRSSTPSPATSAPDTSLWPSDDISRQKYYPSQGPWGIIPSRSIMITNLPKTTQLWTLVELLKVTPLLNLLLTRRVSVTGLGSSLKQSNLMARQLYHSMISAMHYAVSATSAMRTSSQPVVSTLNTSP